jgi:hypothetical protein
LWDWCIDTNDAKVEEGFIGDTPIIKSSPRDYNIHKKGDVPNISSPPKYNTPLRKITPLTTISKPSTSNLATASDKSNIVV